MQENGEGDEYIALSKTRRVTVRDFKGKTYVDLRDVSIVVRGDSPELELSLLPGWSRMPLEPIQYAP